MATALAVPQEQTIWDCRWSSPGHRITGLPDAVQPEAEWVCERDGHRRPVTGGECAACSRWEAAAVTPVPIHFRPSSLLADAFEVGVAPLDLLALARNATRAVFILTAIVFIAIGVSVLTSALAIPFTVFLFLCAAAFAAWGVLLPGVGGRG
jgi:hypothetical protein